MLPTLHVSYLSSNKSVLQYNSDHNKYIVRIFYVISS